MRAALLGLALAVAVAGCQEEPLPPDVVATYRDGVVTRAEAEGVMRRLAQPIGADETVDWLARYRQAAEEAVLERTLMGAAASAGEDEDAAIEALGEDYSSFLRQVAVRMFAAEVLDDTTAITPEAVAAYYEEHAEDFYRIPRQFVSNLYRAHREPGGEEETRAFLLDLKRQIEEGATFRDLVRAHSESESRHLDGRLGWLDRGTLTPDLEAAIFALQPGEVSEPILGGGGGTLFFVSEAIEEKRFPLEDVRLALERKLRRDEIDAKFAEAVAEVDVPEGATVLGPTGILQALERWKPENAILEVGDAVLTVQEFRTMVAELPDDGLPLSRTAEDIATTLYQREKNRFLFFERAKADGFLDQQREAIDRRLALIGRSYQLQGRLELRMRDRADSDPEVLAPLL